MWTPEDSFLGQVKELEPFTFSITYVELEPPSPDPEFEEEIFTVSLSIEESQTTVVIDQDTISGNFQEVFQYTLDYRTSDDQFITKNKFSELPSGGNLYKYTADSRRTKDFFINATATGSLGTIINKQYYITVENDWDIALNLLIAKVAEES
ncbi:hypothetical protein [Synechococcus phage BUCT-ZZ01]|nr:hypothetical protein [Synechococcus phage BUCT-ZZ01]